MSTLVFSLSKYSFVVFKWKLWIPHAAVYDGTQSACLVLSEHELMNNCPNTRPALCSQCCLNCCCVVAGCLNRGGSSFAVHFAGKSAHARSLSCHKAESRTNHVQMSCLLKASRCSGKQRAQSSGCRLWANQESTLCPLKLIQKSLGPSNHFFFLLFPVLRYLRNTRCAILCKSASVYFLNAKCMSAGLILCVRSLRSI